MILTALSLGGALATGWLLGRSRSQPRDSSIGDAVELLAHQSRATGQTVTLVIEYGAMSDIGTHSKIFPPTFGDFDDVMWLMARRNELELEWVETADVSADAVSIEQKRLAESK